MSSLIDEDGNGKSPGVVASQSQTNFSTPSRQDSFELLEQKDFCQVEQKRNIIEKFQTESLSTKIARSIIITQHKLLSPIKTPTTNKVLKSNNNKQNYVPDRVKSTVKSWVSSSNTQSRKPVSNKRSAAIIQGNRL
ncbi:hypothetical protein Hanom_Chr01g00027661 [Helianthus anomalus]